MLPYIAILLLTAILVPIAWIDARRQIIPDTLNLVFGCLGLLFTYADGGLDVLAGRVLAAAGVAGFFLGLRKLYFLLRGLTGLGLGDVKFLMAATLWLGVLGLPWLVLLASMSGLMWHLLVTARGGSAASMQRLPFGPHLAAGFVLVWLWQPHNLP